MKVGACLSPGEIKSDEYLKRVCYRMLSISIGMQNYTIIIY